MSLRVNHLVGFGGSAGSAPLGVTFVDTDTDTNGTTADYGTVQMGTDFAGRQILVGLAGRSGAEDAIMVSGDLGGQSGTVLLNAVQTAGNNGSYAGFMLFETPPSGTSATLTITFGGNMSVGSAICIWSLADLQSATPKDTDSDLDGDHANMTVSVVPGDWVFGAEFARNDTTPGWTGIDEDAEVVVPGSGDGCWGSREMTTTDAAYDVTGDMNVQSTNVGCCIVLR